MEKHDSSYETEYKEALDRHIEEHYPLVAEFKEYNSVPQYAHTLDEYLMFLVKGYINVGIKEELNKNLMELLEDDWFYQWPLIHWAYASRLLYGIGCRKKVKQAIDILLPMVEKGCPGAMYDIGYCHMNGIKLEQSFNKALNYWIKASQNGYHDVYPELKSIYYFGSYGDYKLLPDELRFDFICEIKKLFIEVRGSDEEAVCAKLDNEDRKIYKKLCREAEHLEKSVIKRSYLRETASLFWNDDENPYKNDI